MQSNSTAIPVAELQQRQQEAENGASASPVVEVPGVVERDDEMDVDVVERGNRDDTEEIIEDDVDEGTEASGSMHTANDEMEGVGDVGSGGVHGLV